MHKFHFYTFPNRQYIRHEAQKVFPKEEQEKKKKEKRPTKIDSCHVFSLLFGYMIRAYSCHLK